MNALKLVRFEEVRRCVRCETDKPEAEFYRGQSVVCKVCWKARYGQRKECAECGKLTHAIAGVCPDCKRKAKAAAWRAESESAEPELPPDYVPDPETEALVMAVLRGRGEPTTEDDLVRDVEALQRWIFQVRVNQTLLEEILAGRLSVRIGTDGEPRFTLVPE